MATTILIDTNVLLDDLLVRKPHDEDSRRILDACKHGQIIGFVSAHSFPDMFYIMRKMFSADVRRNLLRSVFNMFPVVSLDGAKILSPKGMDNSQALLSVLLVLFPGPPRWITPLLRTRIS